MEKTVFLSSRRKDIRALDKQRNLKKHTGKSSRRLYRSRESTMYLKPLPPRTPKLPSKFDYDD